MSFYEDLLIKFGNRYAETKPKNIHKIKTGTENGNEI